MAECRGTDANYPWLQRLIRALLVHAKTAENVLKSAISPSNARASPDGLATTVEPVCCFVNTI